MQFYIPFSYLFPYVDLVPSVIGSIIRERSGLPNIFEFPCRRTSIFPRIRGSSLGHAECMVSGDLLVLGTFLFKGRGQSNQNLIVIGALLVPFFSRLVVSIQVDHVEDEGTGVESGGIFHALSTLALDVGKEIPGNFA